MKHVLPFLAPVLALALAPAAQAQELPSAPAQFESDLVELSEHVRDRTVLVYGLVGLGSGAVVSHKGEVITNAHVVAGARYALVQWASGKQVLYKRAGIDYGRDLAVLHPAKPLRDMVPAFGMAARRPRRGDWVVAGGFPGGLRTTSHPTVSLGRVSGRNPSGDPSSSVMGVLNYGDAIRSDVPIFSGNSGGPLVDLQGRLVGINGAVDIMKARSLTIPIGIVRERIPKLKGGVIVLPNGQVLDPRTNMWLRRLFDALDPLTKDAPKRLADASKRAAEAGRRARERLRENVPLRLPARGDSDLGDRLAAIARKGPRQRPLDGTYSGGRHHGLITTDGVHLTPVAPGFAVGKSSRLKDVKEVRIGGVVGRVVARSEPDDLALIALPNDGTRPGAADAPHCPVGSLLFVRGPSGTVAAGIVSADARPTSYSVLAQIQQGGGGNEQVEGVLKIVEQLAKRLKIKAIEQVITQIRRSMEMRQQFAGGTPPRSYRSVISTDAPLAPSTVGAPVHDRRGRLIGVSIGIAHHGTSYVVPMIRVRQAFRDHLRGPLQPDSLGKAKLR